MVKTSIFNRQHLRLHEQNQNTADDFGIAPTATAFTCHKSTVSALSEKKVWEWCFLFCKAKHDRQLSGSYGIIQAKEQRAVVAMKMERLIGILSILLQREQVTAPELAEQFEVSRRTIQRDIEALCRAGIPITTAQGAGGGISIMEGYRVDRTVLTAPEMQAILAGLRSLDSVSGTRRYAQLMEKLSAGNRDRKSVV